MLRVRLLAYTLPLVLLATACTSDEPVSPVAPTIAVPLNQTGPSTPDQRPVTAVQIDHRAGKTDINGKTTLVQGTVIDLAVLSDLEDQVIIEALQLSTTLSGGSARLQFTATTPGTFPILLRDQGVVLATLHVSE